MKYFTFSEGYRNWNEDICYACDDFAFVLDGATVVSGENFSGEESDAKWLVSEWKNYLTSNLAKNEDIFKILKSGVKEISSKFKKLVGKKRLVDFPSSTISCFRRKNGMVEFYVLGDSPIVVQTVNGDSFLIEDTRNIINDDIVKTQIEYISRKERISVVEAKIKNPEIVMSGRQKKNTLGHYYILSDNQEAVEHGFKFEMPEELITKILLLTDGYSQVYDTVKFVSSDELIRKINSFDDAKKIYKKLRTFQKRDSGGTRFVRLKECDDATLVCYDLKSI